MAKTGAKGHVLTVDDLANIKVPDADNAAIEYVQAISLSKSPAIVADKKVIDDFTSLGEKEANPALWSQARKALQKQQPVIALIRKAQAKPRCWFTVNWKSGPAALFPHFTYIRQFARVLYADALIKARDGDMDASLQSTGDIFKLSNSLKEEPTLIGQLVRFAIISIGSQSLRESLAYGKISETQAKSFYDFLNGIDPYKGFAGAMEGERAMGLACYDLVARDPVALTGSGSGSGSAGGIIGRVWSRTLAPMDKAAYISFMGKNIEACKYPYREAVAKKLFPSETDIPKYAVVSRILVPVFSRANIARDAKGSEVYGSQIFLALSVYKSRYGTYPSNLNELRLKIGWKLRKDPLTGKDLIYRKKGEDFILYSVGSDMVDNGGVSRKPMSSGSSDIVWKSKPDPITPASRMPSAPMPPAPKPAPAPGPSVL